MLQETAFTCLRNRGPLKDLNDSKLIVYESKWFPWSSRINFLPFRIFSGPLLYKPVRICFCYFLQQKGSRLQKYGIYWMYFCQIIRQHFLLVLISGSGSQSLYSELLKDSYFQSTITTLVGTSNPKYFRYVETFQIHTQLFLFKLKVG